MSSTKDVLRHWQEDAPDDRMAHLIRDASRATIRALQIRLEAHGVAMGHWPFLRILWETEGLTQKELSDRVGVMTPTTFAAVKGMEEAGYIVRKKLPENNKNNYIYLTPKGRALKKVLTPLAIKVNDVALKGLPRNVVAAMRRGLLTVIENLAEDERSFESKQEESGSQPHAEASQARAT
jgi:DNA-binding MarR family transcriptional regulator